MKKLSTIYAASILTVTLFICNVAAAKPQLSSTHKTNSPTLISTKTNFKPLLGFFNVKKIILTADKNSTIKLSGKLTAKNRMTIFGEGITSSENIINYLPTFAALSNLANLLGKYQDNAIVNHIANNTFMLADFISRPQQKIASSKTPLIPLVLLNGSKHVLFIDAKSLKTFSNGEFIIQGTINAKSSNIIIKPKSTVKLRHNVIAVFANATKAVRIDKHGRIAAQYKLGHSKGIQTLDILSAPNDQPFKLTFQK